jgi:hypothetical protein
MHAISSGEEGRAPSDLDRTAAYRFGAPPWLAGQLGWIRPGSGSAWPDPACLAFFFLCLVQLLFLCCALNQFKNVSRLRKL